jgi:hypothetical protein
VQRRARKLRHAVMLLLTPMVRLAGGVEVEWNGSVGRRSGVE